MDERERSEILYRELKDLEATLQAIEAAEMAALDNAENRDVISKLALATHLLNGNDIRIKSLQGSAEALKKAFEAPRAAWNDEHRRLSSAIRVLTDRVITMGEKLFHRELSDLPQLEEEKVSEEGGGFSMVQKAVLTSNRTGLLEVKNLVRQGIETLRGMSVRPISEIEAFIEDQMGKIRGVDVSVRRSTMDLADYTRVKFLEKGTT